MPQLKPELKTILDRYGIDPRDKSQVWDCHGTLVLYHKAYEIIAAKEGIQFDPPTVIEASSKDKTVSLLVVGRMGGRAEWSIGEAAPGNCKNAYPYAMAEKRAKDRVIGKLVGLAAYVYSEDEADDFKDTPRRPVANDDPVDFWDRPSYAIKCPTLKDWATAFAEKAKVAPSIAALDKLIANNRADYDDTAGTKTGDRLREIVDERRDYIANPPAEAAE